MSTSLHKWVIWLVLEGVRVACHVTEKAVGGGEEAKDAAATLSALHELCRSSPGARRKPFPTERCRPPSLDSCD